MTEAATGPFPRLGEGDLPLPEWASGTMLCELTGGRKTERWRLTIDNGRLDVARGNGPADCVLRADRELFARMAAGKVNAFAAALRGAITVEGDPRLLVLFQRLLPGPQS